jgi:hypothetical protein
MLSKEETESSQSHWKTPVVLKKPLHSLGYSNDGQLTLQQLVHVAMHQNSLVGFTGLSRDVVFSHPSCNE